MTTTQESTETASGHSALEVAVLETIVYSDLFDFPLTSEEIRQWLPQPASQAEVDSALGSDGLSSLLQRRGEYVMLQGREGIVPARLQRRARSRVLRGKAERCGRLISHLPFVRLVTITGSIAAENAASGSDLDYMVITAPGRVWTARAMTMLVVRLYKLRGVTVCPNYLLSETVIELPERDRYTARELLQMIPVGRSSLYQRMLSENDWWRDYLPNATPRHYSSPESDRGLRKSIERVLRVGVFDHAERWIMERKIAELRRQPKTTEAVFNADVCKGHFGNWRSRTENAVAERMRVLLERPG